MNLHRNSENFQAIRAKFEVSKQKLSPKSVMKTGKSGSQTNGLRKKDEDRKTEQLKDQRMDLRSSSGRIKGLSSIASFGSTSTFSSSSFLRRKNNTDSVGSDELSADVNASNLLGTEYTTSSTSKI